MRSFFLSGVICGLFFWGSVTAVDGGTYAFSGRGNCGWANSGCGNCGGDNCGCGGSRPCGGGWDWWSLQSCPCSDRDCVGDCGYPYRWPYGRSCDPCSDGCRPMTCHDKSYCGPLTCIFALFTRDCWCGSGCGERYWGDFYGDPPDLCDPCDRCGNYTGRGNGWTGGGRGCNCGGGVVRVQ